VTASTQGTPIRVATIGDATMEELLAELARREAVDKVGTNESQESGQDVTQIAMSAVIAKSGKADQVGTSTVGADWRAADLTFNWPATACQSG